MLEYMEPEKRSRAVPAHLAAVLLGKAAPENEFDAKLAAVIKRAMEPGRIVSTGGEEFDGRLAMWGVSFSGRCVLAEVRERY